MNFQSGRRSRTRLCKIAHPSGPTQVGMKSLVEFDFQTSYENILAAFFFFSVISYKKISRKKSVLEENVQKNIENGAKNSRSSKSLKGAHQGETLSSN